MVHIYILVLLLCPIKRLNGACGCPGLLEKNDEHSDLRFLPLSTQRLQQFLNRMNRLNIKVRNLQAEHGFIF